MNPSKVTPGTFTLLRLEEARRDTQVFPVSPLFFQEGPALMLVTAGMSLDLWRTAIPELWLLCLVSVKSHEQETQFFDCAQWQRRSMTHDRHKTTAPRASNMWLPAPQSDRGKRQSCSQAVDLHMRWHLHNTGGDISCPWGSHRTPPQGTDTGEIVFDSSCMTQHAPPARELWSRFLVAGCSCLAGCTSSQDHIVSLCFQSWQVTMDVLLLPTLHHLARCLVPLPSSSLAKQMWANKQIFFPFLQMLYTQMAVSLSSLSSPKSECIPTWRYSSLSTTRSTVAHSCSTGNCPI